MLFGWQGHCRGPPSPRVRLQGGPRRPQLQARPLDKLALWSSASVTGPVVPCFQRNQCRTKKNCQRGAGSSCSQGAFADRSSRLLEKRAAPLSGGKANLWTIMCLMTFVPFWMNNYASPKNPHVLSSLTSSAVSMVLLPCGLKSSHEVLRGWTL